MLVSTQSVPMSCTSGMGWAEGSACGLAVYRASTSVSRKRKSAPSKEATWGMQGGVHRIMHVLRIIEALHGAFSLWQWRSTSFRSRNRWIQVENGREGGSAHLRAERVVIAEPELLHGHRVVLVHDGHRAKVDQLDKGIPGVGVLGAVQEVIRRQQDLRRDVVIHGWASMGWRM